MTPSNPSVPQAGAFFAVPFQSRVPACSTRAGSGMGTPGTRGHHRGAETGVTPWGWPWQPVLRGGGTPAWWACCPFGFVADSAPDGCCERLYNGVFWWGPGRGERRGGGRGGEGGNRAKDKPGSSGTASPGPREPAGERRWGSGAELAATAPLPETELSIPLPVPIPSPAQKSPPFLKTF